MENNSKIWHGDEPSQLAKLKEVNYLPTPSTKTDRRNISEQNISFFDFDLGHI